ncbi:hypothetical protein JOB18_035562 [Solea senegalensis]|uniref:Uncharacterized protein n=1 Tax=Solea senegalensis TaxID=28829 RepID=A0AAV6RD46_SOLSE|nr:hypothetical protein JOB18_035562 [Solea senegalensis]
MRRFTIPLDPPPSRIPDSLHHLLQPNFSKVSRSQINKHSLWSEVRHSRGRSTPTYDVAVFLHLTINDEPDVALVCINPFQMDISVSEQTGPICQSSTVFDLCSRETRASHQI